MEQASQIPRQVAYIVSIKDLLTGSFVKEEGWMPNYVSIGGKQISRVNLIGVIIDINQQENLQTFVIDDGTGKISVKNFEKKLEIMVGDIVLLIARIRQYGSERYLTPEIVKKNINRKWKALWEKRAIKNTENEIPISIKVGKIEDAQEVSFHRDEILQKIRDLDDGSGAAYEEVIKKVDEKYISKLMLDGDVFEIKPGRLKVLD